MAEGARIPHSPHSLPVMVGGSDTLDACETYGHVVGLNPDGTSHLNLRHGPGTQYDVKARLQLGQQLWICDQMQDWVAVVVPQEDADCGLSTPQAQRDIYSGACASGWVHRDYVAALAG